MGPAYLFRENPDRPVSVATPLIDFLYCLIKVSVSYKLGISPCLFHPVGRQPVGRQPVGRQPVGRQPVGVSLYSVTTIREYMHNLDTCIIGINCSSDKSNINSGLIV